MQSEHRDGKDIYAPEDWAGARRNGTKRYLGKPCVGLSVHDSEPKGHESDRRVLSPRETPLTLRPTLFGPRSRREEGRHLGSHRERHVRPRWQCYGNPRSCRAHGGRAALTSVGLGICEGVQGLNIWQSRSESIYNGLSILDTSLLPTSSRMVCVLIYHSW